MSDFKYFDDVPFLSADQMVEVDRAMIEDYHIDLIQMMENAGRNLAHLARTRFLGGDPRGKHALILAGTGGNGGGALVCARRLHNFGAQVHVFTTKPDESFSPIPAHQLDILRRMKVQISGTDDLLNLNSLDLIIDGIIGYSLNGAPRGNAAKMINWANIQDSPILSLDTPSGIDTTTGKTFHPFIQATATMTLALPKEGLKAPGTIEYIGELYLADISVPPDLYSKYPLLINVDHVFARSDIIRLW